MASLIGWTYVQIDPSADSALIRAYVRADGSIVTALTGAEIPMDLETLENAAFRTFRCVENIISKADSSLNSNRLAVLTTAGNLSAFGKALYAADGINGNSYTLDAFAEGTERRKGFDAELVRAHYAEEIAEVA